MSLLDTVYDDIRLFMKDNNRFFYNERDLQMHLCLFLQLSGHYDDVDVEYHVPRDFKLEIDKDYSSWDTKTLSIDIMAISRNEFVPIELKYKLKAVTSTISRFGELSEKPLRIITNQGAQDVGRYDFWKDVRRMEMLKKHFKKVHGGIVLFVTNDQSYMISPSPDVNYYAFRMCEGDIIHGYLSWKYESSVSKSHLGFCLDQSYKIQWNQENVVDIDKIMKGQKLYYCITRI